MNIEEIIRRATGAVEIYEKEVIQTLWSGYGSIIRYELTGCDYGSVVVKDVRMPTELNHPRGWNTDLSHERKVRSYQVETAWYENWSNLCDDNCHTPECLAFETEGDEVLVVMEDLDASGFSERRFELSDIEIRACLRWLAYFHARFLGECPKGLWELGSYWHLDTRPDELEKTIDPELKKAAPVLDRMLNECRYQTFVHGDAKVANFCFSSDGGRVAAVDFQYIGGGCGMKDVAYFISSCLQSEQCEELETGLLDFYFEEMKQALVYYKKDVDAASVEKEWRSLYAVAWADFVRFLKGWSPDHWKVHNYSERLTREVLEQLKQRGDV